MGPSRVNASCDYRFDASSFGRKPKCVAVVVQRNGWRGKFLPNSVEIHALILCSNYRTEGRGGEDASFANGRPCRGSGGKEWVECHAGLIHATV